MPWHGILHYRPRIHRLSEESPHKGPVLGSFDVSCVEGFEAAERTIELSVISDAMVVMWHHCNVPSMLKDKTADPFITSHCILPINQIMPIPSFRCWTHKFHWGLFLGPHVKSISFCSVTRQATCETLHELMIFQSPLIIHASPGVSDMVVLNQYVFVYNRLLWVLLILRTSTTKHNAFDWDPFHKQFNSLWLKSCHPGRILIILHLIRIHSLLVHTLSSFHLCPCNRLQLKYYLCQ